MDIEQDVRARAAARNNAEWCEALCRAHGITGAWGPHAWTSARRTPPLYPDAVTLDPAAAAHEITAGIDASPGASVKDSFATLDLTSDGFEVLFDAQWIHRPAPGPGEGGWELVRTEAELERWEQAWADGDGGGLFPAALLAEGSHAFLAARDATGRTVAGAVASTSESVVGVSNLFAADGDLDAAWAGCLGTLARHRPGLDVVGYESGDDLAAAVRAGFTPVGGLRIWLRH
ncbi:hypothetical protein A8W25_06290 [Streptomyces sp. ERV7]|uniref:hypothetical protein n=1 Tax=Streptomyces sp. ERV7 TaxID=1322334 RepID=UPI0007F5180A|nr:hypothetical protein [Streptomyces sp. ERV7]OAR26409.1 hypothetical protein A8W25_06290 [Streptomyces sp. ERV7]